MKDMLKYFTYEILYRPPPPPIKKIFNDGYTSHVIYLKCNIKLIRIINGDYALVGCLILQVEIYLDWEHKHWNLAVQDTSTSRTK